MGGLLWVGRRVGGWVGKEYVPDDFLCEEGGADVEQGGEVEEEAGEEGDGCGRSVGGWVSLELLLPLIFMYEGVHPPIHPPTHQHVLHTSIHHPPTHPTPSSQ